MKEQLKRTYLRDGRSPIPKNEGTSRVMSANKAKNTKPELALHRGPWAQGLRGYRLHPKNVLGRPDVVYFRKKLAIFVQGCFWHDCPKCNNRLPKSNTQFWKSKFDKNRIRDKTKTLRLEGLGWKVRVIWECEIRESLDKMLEKIKPRDFSMNILNARWFFLTL